MENNYDSQYQEIENNQRINALNLKWSLGFNFNLYDSLHNLTNDMRKEIFYVSAHTGVIYDYENNTQRLLQGHCNKITCTAYCLQEDILITADSGTDSMIVIWDAKTGTPKATIFDPHPNGTESLDISADGRYIVTISKEESKLSQQTISLWTWQQDTKKPTLTHEVDPQLRDYLYFIRFNQDNSYKEFVTTGQRRVIFWNWEQKVQGFEFYSPSHETKKIFTQTVFIPKNTQAVTGTQDGYIVVWDITLIMEDYSQPEERRYIKVVNLLNQGGKGQHHSKKGQSSINLLKIFQDDYLVIGASNGSIRFYDTQYRIIAWFEDIDIGSITSISFSNDTSYQQDSIQFQDNDDKDDDNNKPLVCPDFIVVDNDAKITLLKTSLFEEIDKEKKKGVILLESIISPIVSISVQPINSSVLVISCENGIVYEWNYQEKSNKLKILKKFEEDKVPTCVDYSPNGKFLSVATKRGDIYFYEVEKQEWPSQPVSVQESELEKKSTKPQITQQVFSPDSSHLATIDSEYSVCLFKYDHKFNTNKPKTWYFSGKLRVHTATIRSLTFGESMNEKGQVKLRLFSIADDKKLIEYDVQNSNQDCLKIVQQNGIFDIEQEYNPTASIWYPVNLHKEDVLLTVNEEYKIKLWSIQSNGQKVCKKTVLGPTYGGPINKILCLTPANTNSQFIDKYLAYSTQEKVVGIIQLPLDGNPSNTMGLIAHPQKIQDIAASSDGKYFITTGGDDFAINIWQVNVNALEQAFQQDNKLDPIQEQDQFAHFLEGGPEGQTYKDLKDFFYYAQIRSKDEHTTKARKLDGKVPLDSLHEMMRALGYYPTLKEIENMQNEVKYSQILETGQFVSELDIPVFLKLFVNHRPVYGIVRQQIEQAFNILTKGQQKISKQEFCDLLTKEGEKMSHQEIIDCISILLGPGQQQQNEITSQFLISELLGFEDIDELSKDRTLEEGVMNGIIEEDENYID